MSKIYAQASILDIFLHQNEIHVNKGKTNLSTFLNIAVLNCLLTIKLLHQFLSKSYNQLKINISNYLFNQKHRYQSIMTDAKIFWYIYSDIYGCQNMPLQKFTSYKTVIFNINISFIIHLQ